MSHPIHPYRALAALAGISTALCLSACGGSSKPVGQTSSHTSTAATQVSSAATSSTTTTSATRSLSPEALGRAHRAALTSFAACLRKHGIHVPPQKWTGPNPTFNTSGMKTTSARYQRIGGACLGDASAAYNSATAAARR
jgi:hypothetical protein